MENGPLAKKKSLQITVSAGMASANAVAILRFYLRLALGANRRTIAHCAS